MTYIETALVSSAGKLLIQLDNGTVIDAGYVRGSQGPAGKDGQDGAPGIPGAKGEPGVDGAQWHTGIGAPEVSLGNAGDLYMDVANALLPIFQKVGRDWIFLANLKVPPSGGGGGQSGAAGGGGSVIIYPKPDGGAPPDKDNDGQPIDKGDLWYDPNTGYLWIYNGTEWVPIGERPPVSVQPTPPLWNSSGDTNNRYPLVEGDLWFDSDQLALYVAAYDVVGDLRWVITTPADRSVLQDEVDIPDNPFVFPSPILGNGGNPFDGMTVYNDTTKLWYVYNANKNQWIDLPPGVNELSLTAILVRGADDFDETFEFNQADRDRLQTNALCYVNADDHDDFTRIVIPDFDTAGFDWSFILRGLQAGDQLTLIQKDETDPDDIFPFRSDYLTVGEIVENSESFNTEISFESEQPLHVPLFDEPVLIRFKAIVNTGEDEIYYQENAPDPITNPELTAGNIWIDSDDNKLYVWNGTSWSEVTACNGDTDVTKEYVDAQDDKLQQEIIKLQEEISAIAPSTDVGVWKDGATPNPSEGQFVMRLPGGAVTQQYSDPTTDKIIIHKTDSRGAKYNFEDVKVGQLIQLFDVIDQNFGTYVIDAIDNADATFIALDVTWRQGLGGTHVDDDVIVRIFDSPTGGTASEFVLRSGDDMTGTIEIDNPAKITKANELINKGYVDDKFDGTGVPDYLRPYWKKGATIVHFSCEQTFILNARTGSKLYVNGVLDRTFSSGGYTPAIAGGTGKEFAYIISREEEYHHLQNFFQGNSNNKTINPRFLSYCQTERVADFSSFMKDCNAFTGAGLAYLDFSGSTKMNYTFENCYALNTAINMDCRSAWQFHSTFRQCNSLNATITINMPAAHECYYMFANCSALNSRINLVGFSATYLNYMFYYCRSFNNSSIKDLDVSKGANFYEMFRECSNFNVDITNWDMQYANGTYGMFRQCTALEHDFSGWNLKNVASMKYMFNGCTKLTGDYTSWGDWLLIQTDLDYVFSGCPNVTANTSNWILPFCKPATAPFDFANQIKFGVTSSGTLDTSCPPSTNFKNLQMHLHGTTRTASTIFRPGCALKPDGTRFPIDNTTSYTFGDIPPNTEFYIILHNSYNTVASKADVKHTPGDYIEWHADSDTSESSNWVYYVRHIESASSFVDSLYALKGLGEVTNPKNLRHVSWHMYIDFNDGDNNSNLGYTDDVEYDVSGYNLSNFKYASYFFIKAFNSSHNHRTYLKFINIGSMQFPTDHMYRVGTVFFPYRWNDYGYMHYDPKELESLDLSMWYNPIRFLSGPSTEDVDVSKMNLRPVDSLYMVMSMRGNWVKNLGDIDTSALRNAAKTFYRSDFNEDLSQWCVRNIGNHMNFNYEQAAPLDPNHVPDWGYCPRNEDDLDKYIH